MITLYSSPSCTSCRKARSWLTAHDIEFEERNIVSQPIRTDELKQIMALSLEGVDSLISTRSKVFQELHLDLDELSMSELLDLIEEYPNLLRRPMLMDNKRLQIGFNEDEIRAFLPRKVRRVELRQAQMMAGL